MRTIILTLLVILALTVSGNDDPFHREVSYTYDAVNPDTNEFPGGRGTNEMILYTPEYGETTGTNEYGVEAIIRDERIYSIGENDNVIPEDGMVISGHGEADVWINRNLQVGMKVNIDEENKTFYAVQDSRTILEGAERDIEEMQSFREEHAGHYTFQERHRQNQQYRAIEDKIEKAINLLEENNDDLKNAIEDVDNALQEGWFLTMISEQEEMRGIWERLQPFDEEEMIAFLDEIEAHGFNALFPEVFYWGRSIFPSDYIKQFEEFEDWDPMELLIEEGKKRNIEIHAWVENIYVGLEDSPLVQEHSEWITQTRDGQKHTYHDEYEVYYFSWAIPEVREMLLSYYREIAERYPDLAGINLDYIRWPTQDEEYEVGFSPKEREIFKEEHGFDQMDIEPGDDEKQEIFDRWKEELINDFVQEVHEELKAINPDLLITAAVATPLDDARQTKQQNWAQWGQAQTVDALTPMIYTLQSEAVFADMKSIRREVDEKIPVIAGLGTFQGQQPHTIWRQVHQARRAGSPGFVIFDWTHSDTEQLEVFKKGMHRKPARVPLFNK